MKRHGFTLLEISIVLVIIGLIAAGIILGRTLIKSAQISKVARTTEMYKSAYFNFRQKFNTPPGDMRNPSMYWPTLTGLTGNGNGFIDNWPNESALAWRELVLAEMVQVTIHPTEPYHVYDILPHSKGVIYWSKADIYGEVPQGGTALSMTTHKNPVWWSGPVFSSEEAYQIDSKLDDGKPQSGDVLGLSGIDMDGNGMIDGNLDCIAFLPPPDPPIYNTVDGDNSPRCRLLYFMN